jgi:hypothetical protein
MYIPPKINVEKAIILKKVNSIIPISMRPNSKKIFPNGALPPPINKNL